MILMLVICGALLCCNVCKVPPERLHVGYIATYFQKNAQQVCVQVTHIIFPFPPTKLCVVSIIFSQVQYDI
jgi:hypothetical protein